MTADFTLRAYRQLLDALRQDGYRFTLVADGPAPSPGRRVFLRHDVDRLPRRALAMAQLEAACGVRATYYFRTRPVSFDPETMSEIARLGHEIGYHYENLADARGDTDAAWRDFQAQLRRFGPWQPIRTIAMHGRPFSRWDNRDLWRTYDYRAAGVSVEPYLDLDWERTAYLTDTGRAWNSHANIKDTPGRSHPLRRQPRTTRELIALLGDFDGDVMISAHPERWTDHPVGVLQVWATDTAINGIKRVVAHLRR